MYLTLIITDRVAFNDFSSCRGDDNESELKNEDKHHLQLDFKVADTAPVEDDTAPVEDDAAPSEDDRAPGEDGTAPGEPKDEYEDQVKEEELDSEEDPTETLPR